MAPIVPAAFATAPEYKACAGIRADLANCLLQSNCVLRDGNTPQECLKNHSETIPLECQYLRKSLAQCKRGMLDMRKRFRGNPSTTNNKREGQAAVSIIGFGLEGAGDKRKTTTTPPPPDSPPSSSP